MAHPDDGMSSYAYAEATAAAAWRLAPAPPRPGAPPMPALVLSSQPPPPRSRAFAMGVIAVSILAFLSLVQFAKLPLAQQPNFVPLVQVILISNDLITSLLLLMQLRVTRSAALLVLACGYVYAACLALVHLLSFPGVFGPQGVIGGGAQSTAHLYVFWHTGYPLAALAYVLLKDKAPVRGGPSRGQVTAALGATLALVALIALLATAGHDWLPPILQGNHYSSPFNLGRYAQWFLTALAIVVVWKKGRTTLDLWLLVALWSWFIEIALVAIFNAGRYDVGFYAGRIYGMLSSIFVLGVLLVEQAGLYAEFMASTEKEREGAAVRANRDLLRLAMSAGGMGAWSFDRAARHVWIGAELQGFLGFAPGGFPGTPQAVLDRVHPQDLARVKRVLARAARQGGDFAIELRLAGRRGEWRWLDVRGRSDRSGPGRAAMLVGVAMDVTPRKRGEEAQARLEAALLENDRRKDEFLATLAHELRNPLAPIRSCVEVMARSGPLPAPLERVRGVIDRQSRQLTRLVDDLLDVSRIKQGKIRLDKQPLCLQEPLRDAIESTRTAAELAGHEVQVMIDDEPLWVYGDPTRLTQVFANLLSNAIRFTPRGGRIRVTARGGAGEVCVHVHDSGIGIAPEHQQSIFGIFTQVPQAMGPAHGGLGIGLALVRGFVELHGGSIRVASDGPGQGTEFTVCLPRGADQGSCPPRTV